MNWQPLLFFVGFACLLGSLADSPNAPEFGLHIPGIEPLTRRDRLSDQKHVDDVGVRREDDDRDTGFFVPEPGVIIDLPPIFHRGFDRQLPQKSPVVKLAVDVGDRDAGKRTDQATGEREYTERDWVHAYWACGFILAGVIIGFLMVPITLWLIDRVRESKRQRYTREAAAVAGAAQ